MIEILGNVASQDGEDHDSSASLAITTSPTLKSTAAVPRGFGDFILPPENGEDDEDFAQEDKSTAIDLNIANSNVDKPPPESYKDQIKSINSAFGDPSQSTVDPIKEVEEEISESDYDETNSQFEHYEDEMPQVSRRERILIIGNPNKLPSYPVESVFTAQHDDFEGCYCDHQYKVTTQSAHVRVEDRDIQGHDNSSPHNETASAAVPALEDVFCHCVGESITQVPRNLSLNVRKM